MRLPGHGNLCIGGIYHVPIASKFLPTDEEALPPLQMLLDKADVIIGDANAHFDHEAFDITCDQRGAFLLDIMEDTDWQVVDLPNYSRVTRYSSTIPDILLARQGLEQSMVTTMHASPSDHMVIAHTLHAHAESTRWTSSTRFLLSRANWELFTTKLDEQLRVFPLDAATCSVHDHYGYLKDSILYAAAMAIPKGRARARVVPWQSRQCRHLRSQLASAHELVRTAPDSTWAGALVQELRHEYREELAASKRTCWQRLCTSLGESSSSKVQPYQLLRAMEKRQDPVASSGLYDPLKKKQVFTDQDKANTYAQHLYRQARPSPQHQADIQHDQLRARKWLSSHLLSYDWSTFEVVTNAEVDQALHASAKRKVPGHDQVPVELWQRGGKRLTTHMALVFSKILIVGDIPADWLHHLACPVPKPGKEPVDLTSHRPISLLCSAQKVFEKIVHRRLQHVPLQAAQHGFRPGIGATTALATVTHLLHGWVSATSSGPSQVQNRVGMLCLDITSAFDNILPTKLVNMLIAKGVPYPIVGYVWQWTRGRTVSTRWNGALSPPKVMRKGIPQGSSLSPWLFNIYLDDMLASLSKLPDVTPIAYADDVSLLVRGTSVEDVERQLTNALTVIHSHLSSLGLNMNLAKCSACLFTPFGQEHRRPLVVQCAWMKSSRSLTLEHSDLLPRLRMVGKHVLALSENHELKDGDAVVDLTTGLLPPLYVPRRQELAPGVTANTLLASSSHKILAVNDKHHFQVTDLCANPCITVVPVIHAVRSVKLLGVYLETSLSFKSHLQASRKKFHNALALVRRLGGSSWGPTSRLLRQLAKVYVQARVLHGLVAMLPFASPTLAKQVDRWDAALSRAILRCPHGTCSHSSMLESGLQPLSEIVAIQAAKLVIQCHQPLSPPLLQHCRQVVVRGFGRNQAGWNALGMHRLHSLGHNPADIELPLTPLDRLPVAPSLVNFGDRRRLGPSLRRDTFLAELALHVDPQDIVITSDGFVAHGRMGGAAFVTGLAEPAMYIKLGSQTSRDDL